jgi:hypothetical protein
MTGQSEIGTGKAAIGTKGTRTENIALITAQRTVHS